MRTSSMLGVTMAAASIALAVAGKKNKVAEPKPETGITLSALLNCEPRLEVQLALWVIMAIFWCTFISVFKEVVVKPYVKSRPWCEQWTALNKATFAKSFFINFDDKGAFEFACLFAAILAQHGVGGLMCVPSLLGIGSTTLGASLACHGALCEAGWELQDICTHIYEIAFGGPEGRKKNPTPLLVLLGVHHAMGQGLIVPMNLYYSQNVYYHEFVFLLQFAAFIAMGLQNIGYTLDVHTAAGLTKMKVLVVITWVTLIYSRGVRYAMVGYQLMATFRADGATHMLYAGGTVLGLMGLLNTLMILDGTAKLAKFLPMHHEEEGVHDVATEVHGAMSARHRHPASLTFKTKPHTEWVKVKAAVKLGAFKGAKKHM